MAKRLQHSERTKQVDYKNHVVPGQKTGVDAEQDLGMTIGPPSSFFIIPHLPAC